MVYIMSPGLFIFAFWATGDTQGLLQTLHLGITLCGFGGPYGVRVLNQGWLYTGQAHYFLYYHFCPPRFVYKMKLYLLSIITHFLSLFPTEAAHGHTSVPIIGRH